MRCLLFTISFLVLVACHTTPSASPAKPQYITSDASSGKENKSIIELRDTVWVDFKTKGEDYSKGLLDSIVKHITRIGKFRPALDKHGQVDFINEHSKHLLISYDSSNHTIYVFKDYVLQNIHITLVGFNGKRSKKHPELRPGFLLEEWAFDTNTARDSAMGLVNYIYRHPKNEVLYEKSYPQFIVAEKKIFRLTTGADIWKNNVIENKKIIEAFITGLHR